MTKQFTEHKGLNLTNVNQEVLEAWKEKDIFHKSIDEKEGCPQFVFFEGPPSANGHPGIHHVMGRTIKDTFLRYKTMQGYQVKRKAGWDTHGLPVELSVEKELGITKEDIGGPKVSVDGYNQKCRENVMMYTDEWTQLTDKMGYWVVLPSVLTGIGNQEETCYQAATKTYGLYPLGTWDSQINWVSQLNVWEAQQGNTEYQGTVICVGNGGCNFYLRTQENFDVLTQPSGNAFQANIETMAKNAIEYLKTR